MTKESQFGHNVWKFSLVNIVALSFNTTVGQMTEMSQRKKKNRHEVKVASKFHQTCKLLTVDTVVLEHNFDS